MSRNTEDVFKGDMEAMEGTVDMEGMADTVTDMEAMD